MTKRLVLVGALSTALIAVAVLQYRWIGQVSEAEQQRMRVGLASAVNQFRLQFSNEIQRLTILFQPDPAVLLNRDWKNYGEYSRLVWDGATPGLVHNIYIALPDQLLKLNRATGTFETTSWSPSMAAVRAHLRPGLISRPFAWTLVWEVPFLIQPLDRAVHVLIELNPEALRAEVAELASRYFGGTGVFDYQVAVVSGQHLVYQSDPRLTIASFAHPDARAGLLRGPEAFRPEDALPRPPVDEMLRPPLPAPGPPPPRARRGTTPVLVGVGPMNWELLVKHREGSLQAAVAALRWRNLAIGSGTLVLLAVSVALIMVSSRRAQRLARLQIDFVAGVSHELRTPLSVICSAGDNLADGIAVDAKQYGELIRTQGRNLTDLVDQIMQFAGMERGRLRYELRPAQIEDVVDNALEQAGPLIKESGFSVIKSFEQHLPAVMADTAALSQVIENLIHNAIKYSGENRRLAIIATKEQTCGKTEVQILIEDKGIGISREDLPHVFEPFYRGEASRSSQIHGTGLGLYMVREAVQAMGGSVTVRSSPGNGSAFTIHIPVASGG